MHRKSLPFTLTDLRGAAQLATHATIRVADLVEAAHHTIAAPWTLLQRGRERRMHGIAGLVYQAVRGSTRVIGGGAQALLRAAQPTAPSRKSSRQHAAVVAALNGVLGDHLAATHNPLATPMRLRVGDGFARAGDHLLLLVHGLCMNDLQWLRDGHDHGVALATDLGATPIYVHYNTGLHISHNGAALAQQLQALVAQWPTPVRTITIVAHSMGGLVTRAACLAGARHDWMQLLRNIIFLGTPQTGAPLERGGHWADMLLSAVPYTAPFARIGKARSVGITDLRYGNVLDAHWDGTRKRRAVAPLPKDVRCFALAASLGVRHGDAKDRLLGDGLVPVASALSVPPRSKPYAGTHVVYGANHLDLLRAPNVAQQMRAWLR